MLNRIPLLLTLVSTIFLATAFGQTFQNNAGITILDAAPANPYPSNIAVTGITPYVTKVTVTLTGLTHAFQDDAGFLLVGPTGVKVRLMTDCGGNNAGAVTLTFDDAAAAGPNCGAVLVSGTYKPTLGGASITGGSAHPANFPSPAPTNPYSLLLSSFVGTNPNGTWRLYVNDDSGSGTGTLTGWSITITTLPTSAPVSIGGKVLDPYGRSMARTVVSVVGADGSAYTTVTNSFGSYKVRDLPVGTYFVTIQNKRYTFSNQPRVVELNSDSLDVDFTADN